MKEWLYLSNPLEKKTYNPSNLLLRFRDPLLRLPHAPGHVGSPLAPGRGDAHGATARGAAEPRLPEAAHGPGTKVRGRWGDPPKNGDLMGFVWGDHQMV